MNRPTTSDNPKSRDSTSLLMRLATSTALLAVAVVMIAIIFFHAIRGDILGAAFQTPLKEWSATVAGHIGSDLTRAQGVASNFSTRVPVVRNDEIGKVARSFNQMTDRVQQMMDDRERLLADVSHELRSPLARVKVALELLPEGDKRDSIAQDIREMESLTTALLEREQIRNQASQASSDRVNLVTVTAEVIDGFNHAPPGVQLNVPPQSLYINGDEALVRILIQNLVDNAMKFSLPDSKPVEVSLRKTDEGVQIIVDDDGRGIPADLTGKIFEPFVKLNPARGHRAGYGLGLNLCQRIVQAQGGSIEIQQREPRGTRVLLKL